MGPGAVVAEVTVPLPRLACGTSGPGPRGFHPPLKRRDPRSHELMVTGHREGIQAWIVPRGELGKVGSPCFVLSMSKK